MFSRYINRRPSPVKARYAVESPSSISTCTIVESELRYGALKSNDPTAVNDLIDDVLAGIVVLPFDSAAAREYASIRLILENAGNVIGGNDL